MKKRILVSLFVVVTLILAVLIGASFYMLNYALAPDPDRFNTESHFADFRSNHPEAVAWLDSLQQAEALRDTFLVMPSGEHHHAYYILSADSLPVHRVALVLHGWRDTPIKFLHIARIYHQQLGFHVILPDLHAHGLSEGQTIGMGWKERLDVLRWMQMGNETMKCDSFVVHGISMGAATTMNVSGEPMPSFVRDIRFVEDCGYTSAWDEFAYELRQDFHLPPFPLQHVASLICRLRYGWSFGQNSPLRQVARCPYPMLFIHGDRDDFVPSWMVQPLYEAKPGSKQLWITTDCGHNDSSARHTEEYIKAVRKMATD